MNLIRNENSRLELIDNNEEKLLELGFYADEFIFNFFTKTPITISEADDMFLYYNLKNIMDNDYDFQNKLSSKKDNELIWFSDQYCNLDDKEETDRVNRLIIRNYDNKLVISFYNPYFEKNDIKRSSEIVAFSPGGNGQFSRNVATGMTFQDDVVIAFHNTFNETLPDKIKKLVK